MTIVDAVVLALSPFAAGGLVFVIVDTFMRWRSSVVVDTVRITDSNVRIPIFIKCPECKAVSANPNDIVQGWCGACNRYTSDPQPDETRRLIAYAFRPARMRSSVDDVGQPGYLWSPDGPRAVRLPPIPELITIEIVKEPNPGDDK